MLIISFSHLKIIWSKQPSVWFVWWWSYTAFSYVLTQYYSPCLCSPLTALYDSFVFALPQSRQITLRLCRWFKMQQEVEVETTEFRTQRRQTEKKKGTALVLRKASGSCSCKDNQGFAGVWLTFCSLAALWLGRCDLSGLRMNASKDALNFRSGYWTKYTMREKVESLLKPLQEI